MFSSFPGKVHEGLLNDIHCLRGSTKTRLEYTLYMCMMPILIFIASGLEAMNTLLYYDVTNCITSTLVRQWKIAIPSTYEIQLSWELFDQ
jgi:hypothetical protein